MKRTAEVQNLYGFHAQTAQALADIETKKVSQTKCPLREKREKERKTYALPRPVPTNRTQYKDL